MFSAWVITPGAWLGMILAGLFFGLILLVHLAGEFTDPDKEDPQFTDKACKTCGAPLDDGGVNISPHGKPLRRVCWNCARDLLL